MMYKAKIHYERDLQATIAVDEPSINIALESVFAWGNTSQPTGCRSLSVGDVVELRHDDPLMVLRESIGSGIESRYFLCCSAGWQEMTHHDAWDFMQDPFLVRHASKKAKMCIDGVAALAPNGVVPEQLHP